jgi:hypothetical protein
MTAKVDYTYTILRYVHDVMTGEFLNIGLVMHVPPQHKVLTRTTDRTDRIKCMFPDLDTKALSSSLQAVGRALDSKRAEASNAITFAESAITKDNSSLQWSPQGSGHTNDVEETFRQLYSRFVSRYEKREVAPLTDQLGIPVGAGASYYGDQVIAHAYRPANSGPAYVDFTVNPRGIASNDLLYGVTGVQLDSVAASENYLYSAYLSMQALDQRRMVVQPQGEQNAQTDLRSELLRRFRRRLPSAMAVGQQPGFTVFETDEQQTEAVAIIRIQLSAQYAAETQQSD